MSRRIFHCSPSDEAPSAVGAKIEDEDDDPPKFSSDSESEVRLRMHNDPRNYRRSRFSQRHRNREATITNVSGKFTIDLIFARLSTKSFVEKLRGPLLQPEVRAVQVIILIHAAHSCSSHACYFLTPQHSTDSGSSFCSRLLYQLKILFNRDINKCFDKDIAEHLDKYNNKRIITSKYKAKLIKKHENKRIDKYKTKYIKQYILQPLPQVQPSHHSHAIVTPPRHRTAPTPAPHRSNPLSRHPHAAPLQPRCHLHAAPTLPPRRPSAAEMPSPHRSKDATMRSNAALMPLSRRPRPAARRPHAALKLAERLLYAVHSPLAHHSNAAATPP